MIGSIGVDIGGTKIAGALFDDNGCERAQLTLPTPTNYEAFIEACEHIVKALQLKCTDECSVGACSPYADAQVNANLPFLIGRDLKADLERKVGRRIPFGNDANCAALAEATEGAGKGFHSVFGMIMGTGIGGGFVLGGQIVAGAHGQSGEIGHLPLPYYESADGELLQCGCGQRGCIEKLIAGAALGRLYSASAGVQADPPEIAALALRGDKTALNVLDHYFTIVAKALVVVLHTFDPEVIVVSGGLNSLPGMYATVPTRLARYSVNRNSVTRFIPAAFGAMAGLRGAALLGASNIESCG